jgi:hypothetical protein
MRRTTIALTLVALVLAGLYACSADAPTAPRGNGNGNGNGNGSSAVTIQLFTTDANPKAGTCTLVQAIVSFNGNSVPDGTSVQFSTDFGTFSQSGLPLVSVVTSNGSAVTALCGPGAGPARIKATATVQGQTGSATLPVIFQADSGTLPFVSSCSPSFGPKEGGTLLTLNGGRFFGTASTTRVQFTVNGTSRDGVVQSVSQNAVTVLTPGFSDFQAPTLQTQVTLILGTNQPQPTSVSLPSCFSFGTASSNTPTISAILPSSGTNEGHTRVTIVGSGFSTQGVQVFFGSVEASVVSVNYSQIVVLSPPAFGNGQGNLDQTVQVTVKNIGSGTTSNGVGFTYGPPVRVTSVGPGTVPARGPFPQVTVYGQGFQAPVAVSLAGIPASVVSVSATEIVVIPSPPVITTCDSLSGEVRVVNINSGDGNPAGSGPGFTYLVTKPVISGVSPASGNASGGTLSVTVTGGGLANTVSVTVAGRAAGFSIVSDGQLNVTIPDDFAAPPACTAPNVPPDLQVVEQADIVVTTDTGCTVTATKAFAYELPCTVPPTPTP